MGTFQHGSTSRIVLSAVLAAGLLATVPAGAEEIRIVHNQGETVLSAVPETVVVFDLASLDTLQALGVEVAGVPGANFPSYLSQYRDDGYAKVGSLFEPDLAAVEALEPDLIIVGGRSRGAFEALSAIAPTVDLGTRTDGFVQSVFDNTRTLGKIFAIEDEAAVLAAELEATLADLHARAEGAGDGIVLFGVNDNVNGQAPGSRFGIVHEVVGVPSVMAQAAPQAGRGARPAAGSPEAEAQRERSREEFRQALAADPDWMFVIDRGAAFGEPGTIGETLAAHDDVTGTTAWRHEQVVYLDAPTWYLVGGGVQALKATAEQVADALDAAVAD